MNRREMLLALMAATLPFPAGAGPCTDGAANAQDIAWLAEQLAQHYAYLPDRHVDLKKLQAIYSDEAQAACDPHAFLGVLERCLAELHDHHIEAGVNNAQSPLLVPTGAEVWASFQSGRAIVEAMCAGSSLAQAGVRAGDEITAIGGVPVRDAVAAQAPRALTQPDPEADDYTLRVLLAGMHSARRVFTIAGKSIDLPPHVPPPGGPVLTTAMLGDVAHLRVENSLGNGDLVPAFDEALDATGDARALILDLRNTPSGGNTDVAEPILGRFIAKESGYQRVIERDGSAYVRKAAPRGETIDKPLVVLCDRWTGSMGEGMTIGLDSMTRATVVGTRMAGLCGATNGFLLPNSKINVQFPVERLAHLDGTPREKWRPPVFVDLAKESGEDPILARGLAVLGKA
jgi:C-terminal processing protease CtpA/Prc